MREEDGGRLGRATERVLIQEDVYFFSPHDVFFVMPTLPIPVFVHGKGASWIDDRAPCLPTWLPGARLSSVRNVHRLPFDKTTGNPRSPVPRALTHERQSMLHSSA